MMRLISILFNITVLLFTLCAGDAFAHTHSGYSHDGGAKTNQPDWMSKIKDDIKISEISIPGTHDTMALHGGDSAQTQSMSLTDQLKSGIRALDIRCRHINNSFAIHHGIVYQKANFTDVLNAVVKFLKENRGETILMRVKEESTSSNITRSFAETFKEYINNPQFKPYIFFPSNPSEIPTLKNVRGKIVVLRDFKGAEDVGLNYMDTKDGSKKIFEIQDNYKLKNNWSLYDKWKDVKAHLKKANSSSENKIYINYLSGSVGSFPYFVASGHSSPGTNAPRLSTGRVVRESDKSEYPDFPRDSCFLSLCSIYFGGTNILTSDWIKDNSSTKKIGIIMSDFPGDGLIDKIINLNRKYNK